MRRFALLLGDDGSVSVLSYDWKSSVKVSGSVFAELGLFDEASDHFAGWDDECRMAAVVFKTKLLTSGLMPADDDRFDEQFTKLCSPGPGYTQPLYVHLNEVD